MPNILTESLRLKNVNNFVSNVTNQSVYFSFSDPSAWPNGDSSPDTPLDCVNLQNDIFGDMVYMKRVQPTYVVNVVPYYGWVAGTKYQQYSASVDIKTLTAPQTYTTATATATVVGGVISYTITNPGSNYSTAPSVTFAVTSGTNTAVAVATISAGSVTAITFTPPGNTGYTVVPTITFSHPLTLSGTTPSTFDIQPFYVVNTSNKVYKCLGNNSNNSTGSTVQPNSTSTSAGASVTTADGYIWKYMYTIPAFDSEQFQTTSWLPVRTIASNDGSDQWTIQQNALAGSAPYHGSDAIKELNATNLMVKVRVNGNEGGQIVDTNEYRQIGIVSNPIFTGSYYNAGATGAGGATGPNTLRLSALHAATSPMISTTPYYPTAGKSMVILSGTGVGQVNVISNYDNPAVSFVSNWTTIPDTTSKYGIIANSSVLNQCVVLTLATTGTFALDSPVTGTSSLATGSVVKYDAVNKQIYLTSVTGTFTTSDQVNTVVVTAVTPAATVVNLGDILYVENRKPITRYPDQIEDIKVVIEY
jgi:hypothetical protein